MGLVYRGGKDEGWSYDEWLWLGRWVGLGVWEGEWVGWGGVGFPFTIIGLGVWEGEWVGWGGVCLVLR